ncbi:MAG: glutamate-1-semialdehyde 2,1-aminomutase [Planctomycetota bacterium]|jgi:glutamate-1-semialdehyde 2,1-aminomutase
MRSLERSQAAFAQASEVLCGGVNSAARAFGPVGGNPPVIARGSGAHLWDVDGNEYVDLVMSWGPLIRGHAHPDVVAAIETAAQEGTSFGATTERETEIARLVCARMASVEKVRFTNSGTEATMSAVRVARGVTGRDLVLKFTGCWHGHADPFLVAAGSSALSLGQPDSPGVPAATAELTLTAPYNDIDAVRLHFSERGAEIAAVIVEPVAGNMGCIPSAPGFLEGLRALCDEHGSCLILDEVITGFRVAPGGAQERFGVRADLTTMGKTIGGGLPVGAFGGSLQYMNHVAPLGMCVSQGGTLSGNPLAMAAGLATLGPLDGAAYAELEARGALLEDGLSTVDLPLVVQRVGSMMTVFFHEGPVKNLADAAACDADRFATWHRGMLERGVYLPPSQYEAFFVSLAHTEADINRVIAAHEEVCSELATAG